MSPYRPPSPVVVWALHRYVRGRCARHFNTTRLASLTDPARWDRAIPTLFVGNHTNWWDGFLAFLVSRDLGITAHVLMEAGQLDRYRMFARVGALPIRRDAPRAARDDLLAARSCLRANAGLWTFPQGARRPQGERLGRLERGAAELAVAFGAPVRICPAALRYVFLSEQLPEAFALLGVPRVIEPNQYSHRRTLMPLLESDLRDTLDLLDNLLRTESLGAFRTIVSGRRSINKRMDRLRHAVGLLGGPFEVRNG